MYVEYIAYVNIKKISNAMDYWGNRHEVNDQVLYAELILILCFLSSMDINLRASALNPQLLN